jgi:tetratricopeptide (TPR) repeat protein
LRRFLGSILLLLGCAAFVQAQGTAAHGHTLVVMPFENISPTPGLEWLGESFPVAFAGQLGSPILYVSSREERLRAYDRLGIPAGLHPSRATLYRVAEQMDVEFAVLGSYGYDGAKLTATAQLLDMRAQKLLPASSESGALTDLGTLQSALAWDLMRQVREDFSVPKDRYVAGIPHVRLDAFENYVRGVLASSPEERIRRFKEATRLNSAYSEAWLELGETYFDERSYDQAISALKQVSASSLQAREANFYLGLAAYYLGDFTRAEAAFASVAAQLPLAEVSNNLGVVRARLGQKDATEYFRKAVADDPSDPDYHFNLGLSLLRSGDKTSASRELRLTLESRPTDSEARSLLDSMSSAALSRTLERIKANYEENSFRLMTLTVENWAEQQFARSDPAAHARFHITLGNDLLAHGFLADAEKNFREASSLDSTNTEAFTGLAEVYDARGDASQARAQAEASLRIKESAGAYLVLARLDLRENRVEIAAQNADRAAQLEPGNLAAQEMKRAIAGRLAESKP